MYARTPPQLNIALNRHEDARACVGFAWSMGGKPSDQGSQYKRELASDTLAPSTPRNGTPSRTFGLDPHLSVHPGT